MLYPRDLMKDIAHYLADKEAVIVLGARQTGKTSLLHLLMSEVSKTAPAFYIDLESPRELRVLDEGVDSFLGYLRSLGADPSKRSFVFIDEIQYLSDPSRFLKLLVDHHSSLVKVVATGSSSIYMKLKFKDSLVGRKLVFYLYPLDFREFLVFKGENRLASCLPEGLSLENQDDARYFTQDYWRHFNEFLVFGGYPRVVLEESREKKTKMLGEIVSSYIFKDVKSFFEIEDIAKFNKLVQLLASQVGNLLNESSVSISLGISRPTVKRYLSILTETFVLFLLPPFHRNKTKELTKANKVYIMDNGLVNYLMGNLSQSLVDPGKMLENAVFAGLLRKKRETDALYFWRTQGGAEVDFVLKRGSQLLPLEVKAGSESKRSLFSFMDAYGAKKAFLVKGSGEFATEGDVSTVPAWWIC